MKTSKPPKFVYHGIRILDKNKLLSEGLDLWGTDKCINECRKALQYFQRKGYLIKAQVDEIYEYQECECKRRFTVKGIHTTFFKEEACKWAKRNPEIVWYAIQAVGGIEDDVINKYLEDEYGKPYVVIFEFNKIEKYLPEVAKKYPYHISHGGADFFIPMERINPEDIYDIEECSKKIFIVMKVHPFSKH